MITRNGVNFYQQPEGDNQQTLLGLAAWNPEHSDPRRRLPFFIVRDANLDVSALRDLADELDDWADASVINGRTAVVGEGELPIRGVPASESVIPESTRVYYRRFAGEDALPIGNMQLRDADSGGKSAYLAIAKDVILTAVGLRHAAELLEDWSAWLNEQEVVHVAS